MKILTFFELYAIKWANSSSLKLSVSVIVDDGEIIGAALQRAKLEL